MLLQIGSEYKTGSGPGPAVAEVPGPNGQCLPGPQPSPSFTHTRVPLPQPNSQPHASNHHQETTVIWKYYKSKVVDLQYRLNVYASACSIVLVFRIQ